MNPFYLLFSFLFFASVIFADDAKLTKIPVNAGFITALTADDSGVFIGTEDNGVFRYDNEGKITQWTTKDGLGDDNAYALAIDKLGRLWVGHQYSGVSVFNGKEWKNYDVVDGPIGERIFDICPTDGDVWLATSAGITRYRIDTDTWTDITREDGLLEDQCSSLAFLKDGTLIAGTQCHGLAIFTRDKDGNYKHAKNIVATERFGKNNESPVPLTPRGDGLPSNQINKILVVSDKVWIATTAGLVTADNTMTKLRYVRGVDYVDKVKGLYGGAPKDWEECTPKAKTQFLPEDYVTSLSVIDDKLYIGTRQKGFVVFDKTGKPLQQQYTNKNGLPNNYVSVLCSRANNLYIGTYGGGVALLPGAVGSTYRVRKNTAALPAPRKALTVQELKVLQRKLDGLTEPLPKVYAAYYGEDWKTKGDWVGRYGRNVSCLCAASSPFDHFVQVNDCVDLRCCIGPNNKDDDTIRRWVHWLKTDNPKTLYSPWDGYRRQAEWDDHGEAYPLTMDGPDIWIYVDIAEEDEGVFSNLQSEEECLRAIQGKSKPFIRKGIYQISMYFFNKDGHEGANRMRDYVIEIYPCQDVWQGFANKQKFAQASEKQAGKIPALAKSRVRGFWGGVHKSFLVMGAGKYLIKIRRNYSFNTIVSSLCMDHFGVWKNSEDEDYPLDLMYKVRVEPEVFPATFDNMSSKESVALWNLIEAKVGRVGSLESMRNDRLAAYRAAAEAAKGKASDSPAQIVNRSLAWRLRQWNPRERAIFAGQMKEAWRQFGEVNPEYVKQQEELMKSRENGTWVDPWKGWD